MAVNRLHSSGSFALTLLFVLDNINFKNFKVVITSTQLETNGTSF